ncbi:helix-turn-helix transcriptional regulator [Paraburkholderia heleia]|uniref:helix-turn-helix transcriptional regulator n=1 Tax=Paraburkholderia heleia TaxID=634127 RepID=UPI000A022C62|nr:AlpA family phage regulatory protein [Paraburkholderia heleia]
MVGQIQTALTILRRKQVEAATGLSRSTIYARIAAKTFPPAVQLGPRSVGWRQNSIEEFLADPANYRADAAATQAADTPASETPPTGPKQVRKQAVALVPADAEG